MKTNNIKTIAQQAGVSTATVSRVLNNSTSVSHETRQKVVSVIKKMNFRPNTLARGLASNSTSIIGILTKNVVTPHYSRVVDELCQLLFENSFTPMLCNDCENQETRMTHIHTLINMGCKYVLCIGSVFKDTFADTSLLSDYPDVKYIINNCAISAPTAYSIIIDEEYALKLCVDHLVSRGHSRIAYVKDASSFSGQHKKKAFIKEMQERGLFIDELVIDTGRGLDFGWNAAEALLRSGVPFTAVVFGDDITAIGGMQYFQSQNLRIPEDIAVIGFNNSISSECCTPKLTSIDPKFKSIANLMVNIINQLERHSDPPHLIKISPELIIRGST